MLTIKINQISYVNSHQFSFQFEIQRMSTVNYYNLIIWNFVSPVIGTLAFITNVIQIVVLVKTRKVASSIPMIFILNISISDAMVGLVEIFIKLFHYIGKKHPELHNEQDFSIAYSVFLFILLRISLLMSVLNLISITVDRIRCVVKPIHYRQTNPNKAVYLCLFLWCFSIVLLTSYYLLLKNYTNPHTNWRMELAVFPIITLPAAVFLVIAYSYVWYAFRKQNKRLKKKERFNHGTSMRVVVSAPIYAKRKKQEKKLMWLTFTVVFLYLLCWLPISIHSLLKVCLVKVPPIENVVFVIAISNSLLDPIMYFHFIRDSVTRKLRTMLRKHSFTRSSRTTMSSIPVSASRLTEFSELENQM